LFWTILSCAIFGFGSFVAFIHGMSHATADVLVAAGIGWDKLQSVYGLSRWLGIPNSTAWALQFVSVAGCVIAVSRLWRGQYPFPLKAAGLVSLLPLVTPYAFIYDFPLLSVALAYLFSDRPFEKFETALVAFVVICTALFVWHSYPAGPLACLAIATIVFRRRNHLRGAVPDLRAAQAC
jgi:hypothetical protein